MMLGRYIRSMVERELDKKLLDMERKIIKRLRGEKRGEIVEIYSSNIQTILNEPYTLFEASSRYPYIVWGFISLENMRPGDAVELKELVTMNGRSVVSSLRTFANEQAEPMYWVDDRLVHEGYKIVITQKAGVSRSFPTRWYRTI